MELLARNTIGLAYTINREFNKNINVAIQNGKIIVNAPWYFSNKKIQKIINRKKDFINCKLKEYEIIKNKDFKNVKILGKEYIIDICYKTINKPKLNLEKDSVKVILPNKYKNLDKENIVKLLIEKLYDKLAEKNIEFYMEKMRIKLGFSPEDYYIKRMRDLYGKCDGNKKIYINPDIMKFEPKVIEYIILHQFCHLKYKIHSKGFIDLFEKNFVDFIDVEEKIRNVKF